MGRGCRSSAQVSQQLDTSIRPPGQSPHTHSLMRGSGLPSHHESANLPHALPLLARDGAPGIASETPARAATLPVSSQPGLLLETQPVTEALPLPPPFCLEFQDTSLCVPGGHAHKLTVDKVRCLFEVTRGRWLEDGQLDPCPQGPDVHGLESGGQGFFCWSPAGSRIAWHPGQGWGSRAVS